MPDIATLGVRVQQTGAEQVTAQLNAVGAAGQRAGASVVGAMTPVSESFMNASISAAQLARSGAEAETIARMTGVSMASAAYAVDKFGANAATAAVEAQGLAVAQREATAASVELEAATASSGLQLGRLRQSFATLSAETLGVNPIFGRLSSTMAGAFGLGSVVVIGVLAGISAIGAAFNYFTKGAREAQKAQDDLTASLQKWYDIERRGIDGQRTKELDAQIASMRQLADTAAILQGELVTAKNDPALASKLGIDPDVVRSKLQGVIDQMNADRATIHGTLTAVGKDVAEAGQRQESQNVDDLANLIKSHQATKAEYATAVADFESFQQQIDAAAKNGVGVSALRDLLQWSKTLNDALHPSNVGVTANADTSRYDALADSIHRLADEAQSFGKDGSIQNQIQGIDDQLDQFQQKLVQQRTAGTLTTQGFDDMSASVEALRGELYAAGDAMRAAADAQFAKSIDDQYQAELHLYNAVIDQTGAYHELTAAKSAMLEINRQERAAGHALTDDQRRTIEQTYQYAAAITDARDAQQKTQEAQQKAQEAAKQQLEQQQKLMEQPFLNAIQEMQRADASFFQNLFTPGKNAAQSFWDDFKALAIKTFADVASMHLMERLLGAATKGGLAASLAGVLGMSGVSPAGVSAMIPGIGNTTIVSAQQISDLNAFAKQFPTTGQRVAGTAGEGLAIAGTSFGIGSMVGGFAQSHGLGAVGATLGGAASGAATGAAIGMIGGPIGVAAGAFIGGVAGAVGGLIGFKHSAEEAAKALVAYQRATDSVQDQLGQWRAQITMTAADEKAAALLDLQVKYDQIQQSIEQTQSGKKHEAERNLELAQAKDLYDKQRTAIENNTQAWQQNTGAINTVQGYRYQADYFASMPIVGAPGSSSKGAQSPAGTTDTRPIVINLTLDGKTVSKTVLKNFQDAARRSLVGDATRWSEITAVT